MTPAYCRKLARSFERWDPDDLAQDLAVLAWRLKKRGEAPWDIKRSLRNKAIDYWRRKKIERSIFITSLDSCGDMGAALNENLSLLLDLISRNFARRDCILLKYLSQGCTVRECAALLGKSKFKTHNAIERLKRNILI